MNSISNLVVLGEDDSDVDDAHKLHENEDAPDEFYSDLCWKTAAALLNRPTHSNIDEQEDLLTPNQIKVFSISNHKTANRLVGVITILELDNINSTDKENC